MRMRVSQKRPCRICGKPTYCGFQETKVLPSAKPTEIIGLRFCGPRGSYEIVRAISFNAGTHKCGEQMLPCL